MASGRLDLVGLSDHQALAFSLSLPIPVMLGSRGSMSDRGRVPLTRTDLQPLPPSRVGATAPILGLRTPWGSLTQASRGGGLGHMTSKGWSG